MPGEFEFSYVILGDGDAPEGDRVVSMYPSQAEIEDDLRRAGLPVRLAIVGEHDPVEVTDEQLQALGREADQDYR